MIKKTVISILTLVAVTGVIFYLSKSQKEEEKLTRKAPDILPENMKQFYEDVMKQGIVPTTNYQGNENAVSFPILIDGNKGAVVYRESGVIIIYDGTGQAHFLSVSENNIKNKSGEVFALTNGLANTLNSIIQSKKYL